MISASLELLATHPRCDVLIDYSQALSHDSTDILISIIEAKKTLTLDYGLSICEELSHPIDFISSQASNDEKKIIINGVEVPISKSLTMEDLVKLIIDIYEYSTSAIETYTMPTFINNKYVFGSGALAAL